MAPPVPTPLCFCGDMAIMWPPFTVTYCCCCWDAAVETTCCCGDGWVGTSPGSCLIITLRQTGRERFCITPCLSFYSKMCTEKPSVWFTVQFQPSIFQRYWVCDPIRSSFSESHIPLGKINTYFYEGEAEHWDVTNANSIIQNTQTSPSYLWI